MRMKLKKITTATYEVDGVNYDNVNDAKIAMVKSQLRKLLQPAVSDDADLDNIVHTVLINNRAMFNLMLTYKKHSAVAAAGAVSQEYDDADGATNCELGEETSGVDDEREAA